MKRETNWPAIILALGTAAIILLAVAATGRAQPLFVPSTKANLGACDNGNAYIRVKVISDAPSTGVDACSPFTGTGTDRLVCMCRPNADGDYEWWPVWTGSEGPLGEGFTGWDEVTVATLGVCDTDLPIFRLVTDGMNSADCKAGGGTEEVLCGCQKIGGVYRWGAVAVGRVQEILSAIDGVAGSGDFLVTTALGVADGECVQGNADGDVESSGAPCGTPNSHASTHQDGGADEVALDASQITTGTVATARLGSGTASSSNFLRGDQTWATPAGGGSAIEIDADDDGNPEIEIVGNEILLDPDDDGTVEARFESSGRLSLPATALVAGSYEITAGATFRVFAGTQGLLIQSGVPSYIGGRDSSGFEYPALMLETPSATNPTLVPSVANDAGSGVGRDASSGAITLIDNSAEMVRAHNATVRRITITDVLSIATRVTAPASCTFPDIYADTSGAICVCSTSGAWELWKDASAGGSPNCT